MPEKEKAQQEKHEGEDISRFHAACFHQRPYGKKTLDGFDHNIFHILDIHAYTPVI